MSDRIKHVVLLILENHSFDQMLGGLHGVIPGLDGVDPKNPGWNLDSAGKRFEQTETRGSQMINDPWHEHADVAEQLAEGNKGFVKNFEKHYSGLADAEKAASGPQPVEVRDCIKTNRGLYSASMRPAARLSFCLAAVLACGCRTVSTQKAADFASAASSVKAQTDETFAAVNGLIDPAIVDYAAAQDHLEDSYFFQVYAATDVARWDAVFAALERYGLQLAQMTSGKPSADYENAMSDLATQFAAAGDTFGVKPASPKDETVFTKVSSLIMQAKAQYDARKIVATTDPAIQKLLRFMADQIGASAGEEGIRRHVYMHWKDLKDDKASDFRVAWKEGNPRRQFAVEYGQLLDKQRAQDAALAAWRAAILDLAHAHRALAEGDDFQATKALERIDSGIKETRALYDKLAAARSTK